MAVLGLVIKADEIQKLQETQARGQTLGSPLALDRAAVWENTWSWTKASSACHQTSRRRLASFLIWTPCDQNHDRAIPKSTCGLCGTVTVILQHVLPFSEFNFCHTFLGHYLLHPPTPISPISPHITPFPPIFTHSPHFPALPPIFPFSSFFSRKL